MVTQHAEGESSDDHNPLHQLRHTIEHCAHLLPAQGPIGVFIHHNTLHAFEHLSFDDAVQNGGRIFGCEPYLSEDQYREALAKGRIRFAELVDVVADDLGERGKREVCPGLGTILDLRLAMLQFPMRYGPPEELHWFLEQTEAFRHVRPDASATMRLKLISESRRWAMRDLRAWYEDTRNEQSKRWLTSLFDDFAEESIESWDESTWESFGLQLLWRICRTGVSHAAPVVPPHEYVRHRDLLIAAGGTDIDLAINEVLIRFCAAFLDQGLAHWQLPDREAGFLAAFASVYGRAGGPPDRWMRGLRAELVRILDEKADPLHLVHQTLVELGVHEEDWESYLSEVFLALPGWAGMVHQVETRGDRVPHPIPEKSLVEFLAVRLLLERFAIKDAANELFAYSGPLAELRNELMAQVSEPSALTTEERAVGIFQLAQVLGWSPQDLYYLSPESWTKLLEEVESFSHVDRRRVFHLAYECRFRRQTLDAMALHRKERKTDVPRFQVVCCIDEREESFRRHIEEVAPDVETFGAAGFFCVAMYYRGSTDAHFVPLCPVVIRPQHWVTELVDNEALHLQQTKTRQILGKATHRIHVSTRSFALGAILSAAFGVLASIPLLGRVLFPRFTAKIRRRVTGLVETQIPTRLNLERDDPQAGPENSHIGFNLKEMSDIAERLLRDIGLTKSFSRLVVILGHGSNSLNNPHKSAYDCGACGGSSGGPNARALAHILNDSRVRENLVSRSIVIPTETVFVGGLHNTCNDVVTLLDEGAVPDSHRADFERVRNEIDEACARNAHERCRRFMSAPLTMTFQEAWAHVEARSEDLAQTRPELGHATNAICIVGRRELTRGLFFDRRAFLVSYDPHEDTEECMILTRLLQAVVPVCGGINLEYYFSRVDSMGFGCGTKLPHNITSLIGVMDGAASDLRTGLPWQMVEIHEPVRLLFILETTTDKISQVFEKNPVIGQTFQNSWVQLAVVDPNTSQIHVLQKGAFVPYEPQSKQLAQAATSMAWYRGWRDHLEFAEIIGPPFEEATTNMSFGS